jgi:hypothetical protein
MRSFTVLLVGMVCVLAGCSSKRPTGDADGAGSPKVSSVIVSGTVTRSGTPVTGGTVELAVEHSGRSYKPKYTASIASNGQYRFPAVDPSVYYFAIVTVPGTESSHPGTVELRSKPTEQVVHFQVGGPILGVTIPADFETKPAPAAKPTGAVSVPSDPNRVPVPGERLPGTHTPAKPGSKPNFGGMPPSEFNPPPGVVTRPNPAGRPYVPATHARIVYKLAGSVPATQHSEKIRDILLGSNTGVVPGSIEIDDYELRFTQKTGVSLESIVNGLGKLGYRQAGFSSSPIAP